MFKPAWLKKKALLKWLETAWGWDPTHWTRIIEYRECFAYLRAVGAENLDVLEISGEGVWNEAVAFKSYKSVHYPDYDLCTGPYGETFDVVIADHVLPQVDCPTQAVRSMYGTLRPGGHLVVTSSFLIRLEGSPVDCSRWSERGLKNLLIEGGFEPDAIRTASWGNRACAKSNFRRWTPYGFGWFRSLKNEPDFPVSVWAMATRPGDRAG